MYICILSSDILTKPVKAQISNEGLRFLGSLGFYHSIPLLVLFLVTDCRYIHCGGWGGGEE